jgi:catechol 2,3-dioxygenase-like lactoylglutathione lyase family enzyme
MPTGTKNPVIKGCGTHHIAVQTRDWAASLKLYQDVLGMALVAEFGPPEQKIICWTRAMAATLSYLPPKPAFRQWTTRRSTHCLIKNLTLSR